MQIALYLQVLVALLGLAAEFQQVNCEEHFNQSLYHVFDRSGDRPKHRHERSELNAPSYYQHDRMLKFDKFTNNSIRLSIRQSKELIKHEYSEMDQKHGVECCPSVLEMVEPFSGKNSQGNLVDLYRSNTYKQMFYEVSCHKHVVNRACRFVQKQMHPHSKCVQLFSYTYALVKTTSVNRDKKSPTFPGSLSSGNDSYILDYIQVRSGCACVIEPPPEEKNKANKNVENKKPKKSHNKPHNPDKYNKNKKKLPHHPNNHRHKNKNEEIPLSDVDDV